MDIVIQCHLHATVELTDLEEGWVLLEVDGLLVLRVLHGHHRACVNKRQRHLWRQLKGLSLWRACCGF